MSFLALLLALQAPQTTDSALTVALAKNTPAEMATKAQLERLLASSDLKRWQFTSAVIVDQASIPHSHPQLTLHTRHLKDDDLLLSTYIHEQLHWFLTQRDSATAGAIRELRKLFPTIPVGYPEGSSDADGNYVHLIVIYLEDQANKLLLGELRARHVLEFWASDHYTWLYRTVRDRNREISTILRTHGLLYPPPRPRN